MSNVLVYPWQMLFTKIMNSNIAGFKKQFCDNGLNKSSQFVKITQFTTFLNRNFKKALDLDPKSLTSLTTQFIHYPAGQTRILPRSSVYCPRAFSVFLHCDKREWTISLKQCVAIAIPTLSGSSEKLFITQEL